MAQTSRYLIKLWNGKYGNGARFVVFDTQTKKYTEFASSRPEDTAWVNDDLTKQDSYKFWKNFQDEPVNDLNNVVF